MMHERDKSTYRLLEIYSALLLKLVIAGEAATLQSSICNLK